MHPFSGTGNQSIGLFPILQAKPPQRALPDRPSRLLIATAIFYAVVLAFFAVQQAQAQGAATTQPQQRLLSDVLADWSSLTAEQKLSVIEQVIRAGRFDTAEQLLAGFHSPIAIHQQRKKYLLGALRKAQGRQGEAITIFRELLASNPGFQRVRLELAHALFLQQEDDSARHHFELVLGSSANPDLQKYVRSFIDAMDRRKRWHLSGYFSLAPTTNINQGADVKTVTLNGIDFELDENSRKKSGLGVHGGVTGGYRLPLSERLDFVVGGGGNFKLYQETVFNDLILSGEAGPRYRFDNGDLAVYGTAARRWYGGAAYSWLFGARLQASLRLGPKDILRAGGYCQKKRHDLYDYQDGWTCGVNLSADHVIDTQSFLRVLGGFTRDRTRTEHLDYDAKEIGIGYYREIPWGLNIYGQLKYARLDYAGLYPTATEARQDDRFDVTVHVTKRDWQVFGFAPMLQYTYTLNLSNIGFHDYDAHGVNLTWTKRF